jgi:hypothetical protein
MSEILKILTEKTPKEAGYASIDISSWLLTETITNVDFTAFNKKSKSSSPEVLDSVKSTFTGVYLKPYLKGGLDKNSYIIRMVVTTNQQSIGEFILEFNVVDY